MVEDLTGMVDTGNVWIINISLVIIISFIIYLKWLRKKGTATISAESEGSFRIVRDIETGKTYELKECDEKL